MKAYNIEYAFKDKTTWKACILADDTEKAMSFLSKILGQPFNVTTIEFVGKIDGISDEIIHRILAAYGVGNQTKPEKAVKPAKNQPPLVLSDGPPAKRVRGKSIKDRV